MVLRLSDLRSPAWRGDASALLDESTIAPIGTRPAMPYLFGLVFFDPSGSKSCFLLPPPLHCFICQLAFVNEMAAVWPRRLHVGAEPLKYFASEEWSASVAVASFYCGSVFNEQFNHCVPLVCAISTLRDNVQRCQATHLPKPRRLGIYSVGNTRIASSVISITSP